MEGNIVLVKSLKVLEMPLGVSFLGRLGIEFIKTFQGD